MWQMYVCMGVCLMYVLFVGDVCVCSVCLLSMSILGYMSMCVWAPVTSAVGLGGATWRSVVPTLASSFDVPSGSTLPHSGGRPCNNKRRGW